MLLDLKEPSSKPDGPSSGASIDKSPGCPEGERNGTPKSRVGMRLVINSLFMNDPNEVKDGTENGNRTSWMLKDWKPGAARSVDGDTLSAT